MDAGTSFWVIGIAAVWIGFGLGGLVLLWVTMNTHIDLMLDLEQSNSPDALRVAGWPEERFEEGVFAMPLNPSLFKRVRRSYAWGRFMQRVLLWSTPEWLSLSQTGLRARRRFRRAQTAAKLFGLVPLVLLAVFVPGFPAVLAMICACQIALLAWFRATPWPSEEEVLT